MKFRTLAAGTLLYHGTDLRFRRPKNISWFAFNFDAAARWAGWGSVPRGPRRVITCRTTADLTLVDTEKKEDWNALCTIAGDDLIMVVARAVERMKYGGWYGNTEIMLTDTACLEVVETNPVGDEIIPHGR